MSRRRAHTPACILESVEELTNPELAFDARELGALAVERYSFEVDGVRGELLLVRDRMLAGVALGQAGATWVGVDQDVDPTQAVTLALGRPPQPGLRSPPPCVWPEDF